MINNVSNIGKANLTDIEQPAQSDRVSAREHDTEEIDGGSYVYSKSKVRKYLEDTTSANLRHLIEELIQNQGRLRNQAAFDARTVNQAKWLISEDGPLGVKAVSDRIVDFAIAVSGGDKTKLDELKAAIDKGFDLARQAFGGTLPDICNQTYDEVMRKLDEWAEAE